jgi:hypothetical protein
MLGPYAKAALFLVRLVAWGLIIWGLGLCGPVLFLFLRSCLRPAAFTLPPTLPLKLLPALAGLVLLWKARAIAVSLTKDLD